MKEIPLTKGYVAIVDDEDYAMLMQWKWMARTSSRHDHVYAGRTSNRRKVLMHRQLLQAPPELDVDHINRNTLDNRRANLRLCTHAQNRKNTSSERGSLSPYVGVSPASKSPGKWIAQICCNYRRLHLGTFGTEEEAALAYDRAARELFGEFANLNFKE